MLSALLYVRYQRASPAIEAEAHRRDLSRRRLFSKTRATYRVFIKLLSDARLLSIAGLDAAVSIFRKNPSRASRVLGGRRRGRSRLAVYLATRECSISVPARYRRHLVLLLLVIVCWHSSLSHRNLKDDLTSRCVASHHVEALNERLTTCKLDNNNWPSPSRHTLAAFYY